MRVNRKQLAIGMLAGLAFLSGCTNLPTGTAEPTRVGSSTNMSEENAIAAQLLEKAAASVKGKRPAEAISYADQVSKLYESEYNVSDTKYYSARTQPETLVYILGASTDNPKRKAVVVSPNWAYSYYLSAYAFVEMGQLQAAKLSLNKALALSPRNSQFLSELASVYLKERNWELALQTYQRAESAKEFSPENLRDTELARAWRGMGYVYVEQGRLGDAERMYRQCLDLDKNDMKARNELKYLQTLRSTQGAAK